MVGHHGDGAHRGQDQAEGEQPDGPGVAPQLVEVGEERRRVQERREEDQQDEVGVQLDVGHAGREAERRAAQHQQDRIGDPDPAGDHRQHRNRQEQPEQDELGVRLHSPKLEAPGLVARAMGMLT